MIRKARIILSDWFLTLALRVLPKNSSEELLLATVLFKYIKLSENLNKSIPND